MSVDDYLIFRPDDVDLTRSPLRKSLAEPTFVLGAFNPGLALQGHEPTEGDDRVPLARLIELLPLIRRPFLVGHEHGAVYRRFRHRRKDRFIGIDRYRHQRDQTAEEPHGGEAQPL